MTTEANGTPQCSKPVRRGFQVCCLECGDKSIRVYLDDVAGVFQCGDCEAEFSAREIRERIASWEAVLIWVESAPVIED